MKEKFIEKYNYIYNSKDFYTMTLEFMENNQKKIHLDALESLLLDNEELEKTNGYKYLESLKNDKEYLKLVKKSLKRQKKYSSIYDILNNCAITPKCFTVFVEVYKHVEKEYMNSSNKRKKLEVIDEYAKVARFTNDGRIWESGVNLLTKDIFNNVGEWSMIPTKKEKDFKIGTTVPNNEFINYFSKNLITKENGYHFTEEEKEEIYLYNNKSNNKNKKL